MGRLSEKIIAGLLVLFMLIYVGYQIYRVYYNPFRTETAFQYSVTHTISAEGIAIRDEVVIDRRIVDEQSSTFEDGARVAVGQTIAEFYNTPVGDSNVVRMRELEREILALKEAQNPSVSNFTNSEAINRELRNSLGRLTQMAGTGRYGQIAEVQPALTALINKKQVALGMESSFDTRIQRLQAEYDSLATTTAAASVDAATAPAAGYYVKGVDGLEERVSMELLKDCAVADYKALISGRKSQLDTGILGKIVTNPTWYFAALVPKYDIQWMSPGQDVSLTFDTVDNPVPGVVTEIFAENNEDTAVMLIKCNHVSAPLLRLRNEQATINVEQYSGLRISSSAVRLVDDVRGVYVLNKKTVHFKRIDPIYEESSFVISRETGPEEEDIPSVALFDQIIVKGLDLYDGKVFE